MEGVALNTCPAASSIRHDHSNLNPQSKPRPRAGVRGLQRSAKKMKRFTLLAMCFLTLGWIAGWLFNPYETTQGRLIESWRQVDPGISINEVDSILGSPMYDFESGYTWPSWISEVLPEHLADEHRVRAYYIDGMGPQFLLVVFDAGERVSFVGSTDT